MDQIHSMGQANGPYKAGPDYVYTFSIVVIGQVACVSYQQLLPWTTIVTSHTIVISHRQ